MKHNKLGRKIEKEDIINSDVEILHDKDGTAYELSGEYYRDELEKRLPSVDKEIELGLAKELLHSNLRRLTPHQRDVVYYTMIQYSQKDIAQTLGITVSSVQKHLDGARKKLGRLIKTTKKIIKEEMQND